MQSETYQIVGFLLITTLLIVLLLTSIVVILYVYQNKRVSFSDIITQTQLEIQEETVQNISQEIHDNIGLSLTLAKLHLNSLTFQNEGPDHPLIEYSITLISKAISDLSDMSKNLNASAILDNGLLNSIETKLEKLESLGKYDVVLKIGGTPVFIQSQKELILYRIFQEALNNVIKHSKANRIKVCLTYDAASVCLSIEDNGIGISKAKLENTTTKKSMTGLSNIKQRAKMLRGDCTIFSSSSGTSINVSIPLQTNEK